MGNKYSLIVTTNRGPEALAPLFTVTNDDTELIITDSNYNEGTKEWLSKQKGYYQIIYAPIQKVRWKYTKDCILGMNLAFCYAENYWLLRGDDNLEFKLDFFEKVEEDIDYFSTSRGDNKFCVIGQKLWGSSNHTRWEDNFKSWTSRYTEINDPRMTFSFGILPIELIYDLNGYDELYDHSWGFEEEDFLLRGMVSGWKFYVDKELMGYSHSHSSNTDSVIVAQFIYGIQRHQILNGKVRAFNAYDIRTTQSHLLAAKDQFIIKR